MADQNQTDHTETNLLINEEDKRSKRSIGQESMNTRLFLKKMAATNKKQQKAQPKITNFLNFSNSTTFQSKDDHNLVNVSEQSSNMRIRELQQRMKVKDLQIDKMRRNKEIDQNKYSLLYISNKQYKKKSRNAIAASMLEASQFRRAERKQINPKLGYFKDNNRSFVEGSLIKSLRQKITEKHELIRSFQEDRKSKDSQKRQRAIFKMQFIHKEIIGLQKQIDNHQIYITSYKQRLKLAQKQVDCEYALQGWPIVFEQYQSLQLLGKGGFGSVYKVYDLQSNQVVSLKVSTFNEDPQHQQDFIKHVNRQAQIMKKLHHPNIGKFYRLIECSPSRVTFTLQFCNGPELSVYLRKNICLEQRQAKQIVRQILSALSYLYNLKERVIHYDLKPSNIMFHNGIVKILDFGLCKPMETQQSKIQLTCPGIGTYWYLPPECFDENFPMISQKVDIWSTGVIFYQMLYGRKPFGHGKSQNKVMNQGIILNARKVQFLPETPKKYKVSQGAKNFIRELLAYQISQRLDPDQAYQHEYFKR